MQIREARLEKIFLNNDNKLKKNNLMREIMSNKRKLNKIKISYNTDKKDLIQFNTIIKDITIINKHKKPKLNISKSNIELQLKSIENPANEIITDSRLNN